MAEIKNIVFGVLFFGFLVTALFSVYSSMYVSYKPPIQSEYNNTYDHVLELYNQSKEANDKILKNTTTTTTGAIEQVVGSTFSAIKTISKSMYIAEEMMRTASEQLKIPPFIFIVCVTALFLTFAIALIVIFFKVSI